MATPLRSATDHLVALLDSDMSGALARYDHAETLIAAWIERNRRVFESKMAGFNTGAVSIESVNEWLAEKVLAIERFISQSRPWRPLDTVEGLREMAQVVMAKCPQDRARGTFLTRRSAESLLDRHPPVRLSAFIRQSGTKAVDDPLAILALTRHTEGREWQAVYLDLLSRTSADDFEERDCRCHMYDSRLYRDVLDPAEASQKPWRISHNKEAGIINFFTLEEDHQRAAPLFQAIAVSIHYFFEATSAGCFFNRAAREYPSRLGERVVDAITTTRERLPHFRPNVYSEHMYWDEAMELFWRSFYSPDASFFADSFYVGEQLTPGSASIVSLNAIDVLWNVNLLQRQESRDYFGDDLAPFLYHFRDAAWYDIVRELSGHSIADMRAIIAGNLDLGDVALTAKVFERRNHA